MGPVLHLFLDPIAKLVRKWNYSGSTRCPARLHGHFNPNLVAFTATAAAASSSSLSFLLFFYITPSLLVSRALSMSASAISLTLCALWPLALDQRPRSADLRVGEGRSTVDDGIWGADHCRYGTTALLLPLLFMFLFSMESIDLLLLIPSK